MSVMWTMQTIISNSTLKTKYILALTIAALLIGSSVHVRALDLDAVMAAAEKALETPEARAKQEEDMRQFVAFQVRMCVCMLFSLSLSLSPSLSLDICTRCVRLRCVQSSMHTS